MNTHHHFPNIGQPSFDWNKFAMSNVKPAHTVVARRKMDWHHVQGNQYQSDSGEIHVCDHLCSSWVFRQDGLKICAISGRCVMYGRGKLGGNSHLKRKYCNDVCGMEYAMNFNAPPQQLKSSRSLNKIHSIQKRRSFVERPKIIKQEDETCNWDEPTYGAGISAGHCMDME